MINYPEIPLPLIKLGWTLLGIGIMYITIAVLKNREGRE